MHSLKKFKADKSWTLFLDRDGVINKLRVNDYVKSWDEFEFEDGVLEALAYCNKVFGRICITTNQQGIGKGLMSESDLDNIHHNMVSHIKKCGGRIDKVYHCPGLAKDKPLCRKPEIGMGLEAVRDFPEIDFSKSIMVGDSLRDMEFADRLGMQKFLVNGHESKFDTKVTYHQTTNLWTFASYIRNIIGEEHD